jgi:hypothetical protein
MEKRLPDLPMGILVMPRRVVESMQKFFAVKIARPSVDELVYERAHRVIVSDGEFVRMLASHRIALLFLRYIRRNQGGNPAARTRLGESFYATPRNILVKDLFGLR